MAAFPVTIEHKYGSTEIPAEPRRAVAAGFNDADYALAFGIVPVGVRDFIGAFPEEERRWPQEALDGADPEKVSDAEGELNYESIAALRPDLIIGYSYLQEEEYEKLSQIARTVVEPTGAAIQRSLARVAEGRTAVVIAHRLSTVRHADRIWVLERGSIAEAGTHEELLEDGGLCTALWRVQTGEAVEALR